MLASEEMCKIARLDGKVQNSHYRLATGNVRASIGFTSLDAACMQDPISMLECCRNVGHGFRLLANVRDYE